MRKAIISVIFLGVLSIIYSLPLRAGDKPKYGVYIKVVEAAENDFEAVCSAIEEGINASRFQLAGKHDLDSPNPYDYLSRVFVLNDSGFTQAVGQLDGPRFLAVAHRISVYQGPGQNSVLVNMVNPEATARVYFHKLPKEQYQNMLNMAQQIKEDMIALITNSVQGNIFNAQLAPLREEKALNGYNGDGMAKVMAMFRNFESSLHTEKKYKTSGNGASVFEQACQELEANLAKTKTGWKLIATIDGGHERRYYGISQPKTEEIATRIVGESRKSKEDPSPGIDHSPAFPIEVLIYSEKNEVKVATLGEMWRMQFYFWDAGYAAFAKHAKVPSDIYNSIKDMIKGKK